MGDHLHTTQTKKKNHHLLDVDRQLIPSESTDLNGNVHTDLYEADDLNAGLISQFQQKLDPEDGEIIDKTAKDQEVVIEKNQEITDSGALENTVKKAPFYIEDAQSFNDDGFGGNFESRLDAINEFYEYPRKEFSVQIAENFSVPNVIWVKLLEYQREGIKWLWKLHQENVGGILSDEMGLGKTVQIISFLGSLHFSQFHPDNRRFGCAVVIAPVTLLKLWLREFYVWWPFLKVVILHHTGSMITTQAQFIRKISSMKGVVVLTTYSTLLKHKRQMISIDWEYVILDEGHKIKNPETCINILAIKLKSTHRIIVSGTPIQNNLKELWSLLNFVYPGLLGTLQVFLKDVAAHITRASYSNASTLQVKTGFKCAKMLKQVIEPYLLRRTKKTVQSELSLPSKSDFVMFCRLSSIQSKMYQELLNSYSFDEMIKSGYKQMFKLLMLLRKVCNHPLLFRSALDEDQSYSWNSSSKMIALNSLLQEWHLKSNKVLIYSQSRKMLDIITDYCNQFQFTFVRMDGKCPISHRQKLIDKFNRDGSIFIFLLTTKVGGVGISLIGADRVVIFDPDWNPSTDTQAKERVWRIGQTKDVAIYRLLTSGTIEEKMYNRQVFKQFLANKILENPSHVRAKLNFGDVNELFSYSEHNSKKSELIRQDKVVNDSSISLPESITKKRKYKWRKQEDFSSDDNITSSLIDRNKIIKKIKAIDDSKTALTDIKLIDAEAEQIANQAIASMSTSGFTVCQIPKTYCDSKEPGLQILNNLKKFGNLELPSSDNLSSKILFAQDFPDALKKFLLDNNGKATTKEIVTHFKEKIKEGFDTITFKNILRKMSDFRLDTHTKIGHWCLKRKFH